MSSKIILTDQGIQEEYGVEDGKVHTLRKQDIEPFLRSAAQQRNHNPINHAQDNGLYKRATVPVVEVERWKTEYGFDWYNSSETEKQKWMKLPIFKRFELRGRK